MVKRVDRTADTRHRIERAALENFVEKGFGDTSIRDIARDANISLGALYNHFSSKEELATHLFSSGWSEMGRELRHRAQDHDALYDKLRAMIRYVFRRFDQDWLLVTYVYVSRHQHLLQAIPAGRDHPYAGRDNPYIIFRLVIADALRREEIPRVNLELATSLVMGAVIQATDSRIMGRIKGPLLDQADETAQLCARMLGATVPDPLK